MGKYTYAVLTVFLIELALWLFGGTSYSTTSIFDVLLDPSTLISNPFYIAVIAALALLGVSAIIPGTFIQINIYALYASLAGIFLSFSISIAHLWIFINGQLTDMSSQFALVIPTIIVAPFLLFYLISTVEWVRGN